MFFVAFSSLAVGLRIKEVPLISFLRNTRSPRNTLVYKVEEDESGTSESEDKPAVQCRYEIRSSDEEGGGRTTYNRMRAKKQDFARVELFLDKVDLKASLDDDGEDGEGGCGEKSKEDHVQACDLLNVSFLKKIYIIIILKVVDPWGDAEKACITASSSRSNTNFPLTVYSRGPSLSLTLRVPDAKSAAVNYFKSEEPVTSFRCFPTK